VLAEEVLQQLLPKGVRGVLFMVDACRTDLGPAFRKAGIGSIHVERMRGLALDPVSLPVDERPVSAAETKKPGPLQMSDTVKVGGRVLFFYSTDATEAASDRGCFAEVAAQYLDSYELMPKVVERIRSEAKRTPGCTQNPTQAGELDHPIRLGGAPPPIP
jgi:hypothetical protein